MTSTKRILQIVSSIDEKNGGVASGIINTINASSQLICRIDVISGDNYVVHFKSDKSVHYALGSMKTSWAYIPGLEEKLRELLKQYDIVVINGLWQYTSYCTIKIIKEQRKSGIKTPMVYIMPHGMLDPWFQRASSRWWKALRNEVYWALVERQVVNEADGLLFTCQQELELARTTFWGYKPKREINVGYGILPPPACTEEISLAFQHPRPYFLFLSRIHEKKGVDILIAAYQKLRKENTAGGIPDLVIAGPGLDSTFGQKVQRLVQSEFKEYISFVGMLSGDKKWGALYGCEAFVLPSHQENFGIAVVEALACGKPVLISDQVNICKEVATSQSGIVFSIQNSNLINSALKEYLEMSSDQRQEMSQNGKTCFNTYFRIDTHTERLINSIESRN